MEPKSANRTTDAKVVEFKTGDEPEFKKPDHDPHGETSAAAAHSYTTCDNPTCDTAGLVPTGILEDASGLLGGPEYDVVCSDACAD